MPLLGIRRDQKEPYQILAFIHRKCMNNVIFAGNYVTPPQVKVLTFVLLKIDLIMLNFNACSLLLQKIGKPRGLKKINS
jgi:hypothetical protein